MEYHILDRATDIAKAVVATRLEKLEKELLMKELKKAIVEVAQHEVKKAEQTSSAIVEEIEQERDEALMKVIPRSEFLVAFSKYQGKVERAATGAVAVTKTFLASKTARVKAKLAAFAAA